MPELIAKGSESAQCWRRSLTEGTVVRLGRAPAGGWAVPWDSQISREHVELRWGGGRLKVRRLESTRNPVFYHGQAVTDFSVTIGDHFVIGSTTFHVAESQSDVSLNPPSPREQHTFRPGDLRRIQFRNADHRLEVLSHLPELITESTSDEMFSGRLVGLLLAGISRAEAAALVERTPPSSSIPLPLGESGQGERSENKTSGPLQITVRQSDRRRDAVGRFQPSQRLILEALDRSESVLHVWSDGDSAAPEFTVSENLDWAFCTPVPGDACRGWALYVAGSFGSDLRPSLADETSVADLKGDLRFAELVAELVGALRQVRRLEEERAGLRQFFSPPVLEALSGDRSGHVLDPREAEVTVLFCDLRGFSKEAEQWRDNPSGLLNRVSEALGVMSQPIFQYGGVIGDFQGDSAMGFWGWPLPSPDGPLGACLAALDIRAQFQQAAHQRGHSLADFQAGIGIAHGRAVAGKIGTPEHVEVTVFGPVVNLASRLEGMTKQLRVPILLDEYTAEYVRQHLPRSRGRCRRLGRVRPYGMETPLMVSELLPPADQDPILSDQSLLDYDAGVEALLAGRWSEAIELLHRVPAKDRAKDFLTIFIAQNNYQPPTHWDGVIPMPSK